MDIDITLDPGQQAAFEAGLVGRLDAVRPGVQAAMRDRFFEIVMANFGIVGPDRPNAWDALSPLYAQKVGRTYATLHVSGALQGSVMKGGAGESAGQGATVNMSDSSVPYAMAHHNGVPGRNLPQRRVFPLDDNDQVLPWTESQVVEAAEKALAKEVA